MNHDHERLDRDRLIRERDAECPDEDSERLYEDTMRRFRLATAPPIRRTLAVALIASCAVMLLGLGLMYVLPPSTGWWWICAVVFYLGYLETSALAQSARPRWGGGLVCFGAAIVLASWALREPVLMFWAVITGLQGVVYSCHVNGLLLSYTSLYRWVRSRRSGPGG